MTGITVRILRLGLIVGLATWLVACGNSSTPMTPSGPTTPPANVSVTISPTSAALAAGQSQTAQFTATVSGTSNTAVSWSVNSVAGGNSTTGTIGADGLYAAPETLPATASSQVVTVTATSMADSTKSASASVALVVPGTVTATKNPQVAQYSFTSPTDATVTIQFGADQTYGLQTWSQPVPTGGGTLNMLVAGMRGYTTYHMRASVQFANGASYVDPDQVFTTGGLPISRLPDLTVPVPAGPGTSPGVELLSLAGNGANAITAVAVDLEGNVIWYYDLSTIPNLQQDIPFPIKLLPNGHMKIVVGSVIPNPPVSEIQEIDLAGNLVYQLTTAQLNSMLAAIGSPIVSSGFHHDFAVLPTGHTVYLVLDQRKITLTGATTPTLVTGDALIDIDQNGNLAWTWSTFDHFDVNNLPVGSIGFPDWTHGNAIIYSPEDDNLIMSSRDLSWVTKIDYENGAGSGAVLWRLGPGGDFALTNGGASDWFYNEHYPNLLQPSPLNNPTLAIWDNGNRRPDPVTGLPCQLTNNAPGGGSCYSRGVVLSLDVPALTATILWQDNLSPEFSDCCGNISVFNTTNGTNFFGSASGSGNVEMGAGGQSIFAPQASEALEVTQTPSPQVVWQMNLTNQFSYRMVRIPSLYPGVSWAP